MTTSTSREPATASLPPRASGSVTMSCDANTVGYARMWVSWQLDVLLPWVALDLFDDIQLVVSELVTNSMRAKCTTVVVTIARDHGTIRLGVQDDAAGTPTVLRPVATATSGRGLLIVAAIAARWGVEPDPVRGKTVWADFDVPEPGMPGLEETPDERRSRRVGPRDIPLDAVLGDQSSRTVTDALVGELLEQVRRSMNVDTAAILLFDDSRQFLVATAARGIEEEVRQGVRVRAGSGFAGRIASEARPIVLNEITARNVVNPLLMQRGIRSMLGVPIFEGQQVTGVMHVGSLTRRQFLSIDEGTLQRAAGRAAQLLVRHRAFVDRAGAAALLQSLTPRLPDLPGLDLAARYVPGSEYGVGGDWYDVFQLANGLVAVAIGDVMGHGLHAATVMGRVRSSLRAYALEHDDPAEVLTLLDHKIQRFEPGHLATVLYALIDPASGEITASTAGHLPPIVVHGAGSASRLRLPIGPPIGVPSDIVRRTGHTVLPRGATLVLYTDGIVERRTGDLDVELGRLESALAAVPLRTAEGACAQAMNEMLGDREPEDDISLLAVTLRRTPLNAV